MRILEHALELPWATGSQDLIAYLADLLERSLPPGLVPVRFVITKTSSKGCLCEVGCIEGLQESGRPVPDPIFHFRRRPVGGVDPFTVVLMVPTGIGAEIGGHVGDATPAARVVAAACDRLITHPNVVNAADLNEMPPDSLYVEGSVISRLLMGTLGLLPTRSNRLLVVIHEHDEKKITGYSINAVNAGRASCGYQIDRLVRLDSRFRMKAIFTKTGRAAGRIDNLEELLAVLDQHKGEYDAVALSSVIDYSSEDIVAYYKGADTSVNPWGGVEAMLTHTVTSLYDVPSAHSPQMETTKSMGIGIGHPTMAAELISAAYLQCILKGLHQSPRLVTSPAAMSNRQVVTAADVSCLVMPDRCLGLPVLAALAQNIPVIAVKDQTNRMRNDLGTLPWAPGQLHFAENYLEAAGLLCAMRSGIALETLRRPLARVSEKKVATMQPAYLS